MKDFNISPFSSAQAYSGLNKAKKTEQTPKAPQTEKTDATPKTKELGDDLLTYNFYGDMGLDISNKKQSTIPDLYDITEFNVSSASKADKLAATNIAKEAGLSPLTQAYMYGNISDDTKGSLAELDSNLLTLQDPNYTFYVPEENIA
jgi:hypothetical protein